MKIKYTIKPLANYIKILDNGFTYNSHPKLKYENTYGKLPSLDSLYEVLEFSTKKHKHIGKIREVGTNDIYYVGLPNNEKSHYYRQATKEDIENYYKNRKK